MNDKLDYKKIYLILLLERCYIREIPPQRYEYLDDYKSFELDYNTWLYAQG
jgi:hypothetical protein